jgi:hypothetical protein
MSITINAYKALAAAGVLLLCAGSALAQGQFTIAQNDVFTGSGKANSYSGPSTGGTDLRGVVEDGGVDAYDLAGLLFFNNQDYASAPAGLNIWRRTDTLTALNVYRWVVRYTNTSSAPITVPVASFSGLGLDGRGAVAASDPFRYVVYENADPDRPNRPTDPVLGMMNGNNQWTLDNVTLVPALEDPSDVRRNFSITLSPGQSLSLMFADFLAMSLDSTGNAVGDESDVDLALATTQSYFDNPLPLLQGLDQTTIASLANWSLVSIPTPGAAFALGLGGVVAMRRRRRCARRSFEAPRKGRRVRRPLSIWCGPVSVA